MKEYIINEITFSDLFSLGRSYLFTDFLDSLKEEIESNNTIVIENNNNSERVILSTLKELEEYKKRYSL